jgi:hypothetical protein
MTSTIKVNKIEKESGSTLTLGGPSTAVTLACGATQTGFGRTGTVNWCTTAKTSPLTVASGNGYFINTSGGVITVTLPSSPSAGDIVAFKDYGNTWQTNNVTVGRGGSKINGECACATLSTKAQSVTLIYVDGTKGWQDVNDSTANISGASFVAACGGNTTITCGDFKTHIFTADGPLNVTAAGNAAGSNTFEYLVVAGGGAGGGGMTGGSGSGAGAGGFRYFSALSPAGSPLVAPAGLTASVADVPITVGAGGAAYPNACGRGTNGGNSVFSTITSAGGGAGGTGKDASPQNDVGPQTSPTNRLAGVAGGSGGGARGTAIPGNPAAIKGPGNTPPVSPPQGNDGGDNPAAPEKASGGGGGAGAAGATGSSPQCSPGSGGDGGIGSNIVTGFFGPTAPSYGQAPSPLAPNGRYFSGGGAGNGYNAPASGTGGAGGGGDTSSLGAGGAGDTNTGGGGSGGSGGPGRPNDLGGAGGSGFVAIRYKFQ